MNAPFAARVAYIGAEADQSNVVMRIFEPKKSDVFLYVHKPLRLIADKVRAVQAGVPMAVTEEVAASALAPGD